MHTVCQIIIALPTAHQPHIVIYPSHNSIVAGTGVGGIDERLHCFGIMSFRAKVVTIVIAGFGIVFGMDIPPRIQSMDGLSQTLAVRQDDSLLPQAVRFMQHRPRIGYPMGRTPRHNEPYYQQQVLYDYTVIHISAAKVLLFFDTCK